VTTPSHSAPLYVNINPLKVGETYEANGQILWSQASRVRAMLEGFSWTDLLIHADFCFSDFMA
jgi:hypothetical protein